MENIRFLPFQRNSYFTGKLLTARDFKAEQQYINDKRRLINRFLCGTGVVCGMTVTRLDGKQLIIEPGFALDGTGREIVIDNILIRHLPEIDGFESSSNAANPHVYLCIEYAEEEKEPMHGIARNALAESEFNRIEEGFRLYLTGTPPALHRGGEQRSVTSPELELSEYSIEPICLAKIELLHWGPAYEINKVEALPFGQLVISPGELLNSLNELRGQVAVLAEKPKETNEHDAPCNKKEENKIKLTSSGTVTVAVPKGAKPGQTFYSAEIPHGLGSGNVFVTLGLRVKQGAVFGSPAVFRESADYEFAARVNYDEGLFQAGVLVKNGEDGAAIVLDWMAYREKEEMPGPLGAAPKITVVPGVLSLKPGEGFIFKAEVQGITNRDVKWSVEEKNGGSIDSSGLYTAPYDAGVYTVSANSAENPELSGKAFVVVRV